MLTQAKIDKGWKCADSEYCFSRTSWRTRLIVDVGVTELVELVDIPFDYVKCGLTGSCGPTGNVDPNHPSPFYGTSGLTVKAAYLMNAYRAWSKENESPSELLRISDISLPKGGRFDIKSNWAGSHKAHRKGINFDVSKNTQIDGRGINFGGVDQVQLDSLIRGLGLIRRTEDTVLECPDLKPGENPCIHVSFYE
jgi:hypothetical protein